MILVLDTTNPRHVICGLSRNERSIVYRTEKRSKNERVDATALALSFLKAHTATPYLAGVIVRDTAGTFSGVRLGILLANSLALACAVPVTTVALLGTPTLTELLRQGVPLLKKRRVGLFAVPRYHRAPNITKAKARRKQRARRQR